MRTLTYELELGGHAPSVCRVTDFTATEALSQVGRATVRAVANARVDREAVLGKPATLRLRTDDGQTRGFFGLCWDVAVQAVHSGLWIVECEIAPKLATLGLGRGARIFQHQSVPAVVKQVLKDASIPESAQVWTVMEKTPEHALIVQYDESDLSFISRLLAEEGIGFAVQNVDGKERVVFFDDSTRLEPIAGDPILPDRDRRSGRQDYVFDFAERRAAASDAVMLRDYDFKRPGEALSPKEAAPKSTGREVYDHPGGFVEQAVGGRRVKRTLERLTAAARTFRGGSDCPRLEPGRRFEVEGHPRRTVNGKYLVVAVTHRGYAGEDRPVTYENRVTAQPYGSAYRPPALPAPRLGGVQVAFVTGPSGQEQHADEFGRVKVRFPWDRSGIEDDRSSAWLRVGQLPLGGSMVLPRVGFEVLVDFELGDLDRPFVSGHLYNGEVAPPYALPGGSTRSSVQSATLSGGPGANELRFEDAAGSEELFLNASRDLTISVENDAAYHIGHDEAVEIGSNHVLSVGTDLGATVGGSRTLTVLVSQKTNVEGSFSEGVGADDTVQIGGMYKVKVGGDHEEKTAGTLDRSVRLLQSVTAIKGYDRRIKGASTTKVNLAWLETALGSRSVKIGKLFTETVAALKMIKAKSYSVACGAGYKLTAASQKVDCGGSRSEAAKGAVSVKAKGAMTVKAANVLITATKKLVVKGDKCTIELKSDGEITISAPKVHVSGVKGLDQQQHKSN